MPKSIINQYLEIVKKEHGRRDKSTNNTLNGLNPWFIVLPAFIALCISTLLIINEQQVVALILAAITSCLLASQLLLTTAITAVLFSGVWLTPFLFVANNEVVHSTNEQQYDFGIYLIASICLSLAVGHLLNIVNRLHKKHQQQKQANSWLREFSETLTRSDHDAIKIYNLNCELVAINAAGLRLLDAENISQTTEHDWTSELTEQELKKFRQTWTVALAEGFGEFYGYFATVNATKQYCHVQMTPIKDQDKNTTFMVVVTTNLTTLEASKNKLIASNYELNQLFDSLNGLYFGIDKGGVIRYSNQKAELFLAKSKENLVGFNIYNVLPVALATKTKAAIAAIKAGANLQDEQYYDNDSRRWLKLECVSKNDGFNIFITDVTLNVEKNQALQQALASAEMAQELESFATWEYDLVSLKLKFSDNAKELLELDSHTESNTLTLVSRLARPQDRVKLTRAILDVTYTKDEDTQKNSTFTLNTKITDKVGETRHVRVSLRCLRDDKGQAFKIIGSIQDVSEQKAREVYLKEAELFVRGIIDSLPNQLCVINSDGTIISVNRAWNEFALKANTAPAKVGRTQNYIRVCEQAVDAGCPYSSFVLNGIQQVIQGDNEHFIYEYPMDIGEQTQWFNVHVQPLKIQGDMDNNQVKNKELFVISHENVTEYKQLLKQAENQYRLDLAVATSREGFWDWNIPEEHCYFSSAFCNLVQQNVSPATNFIQWLEWYLHPDNKNDVIEAIREVLQTSIPLDIECRLLAADDRYQWFRLSAKAVSENQVVTRLVGTISNIEEQRGLRKLVAQTERQFREMAKHIPDVFWDYDIEEQRFTYVSPAHQITWGMPLPANQNTDLNWWLFTVVEDDRNQVLSQMRKCIVEKCSGALEYRMKFGNKTRWIRSSYYYVSPIEGKPERLVGVARDITSSKTAEAELRRLAEYDELTGLPNRTFFMQQMSHLIEQSAIEEQQICIAFLDIDRFTVLNDAVGFDVGDELLRQVSVRISNTIRTRADVYRIAGDEFAVCISSLQCYDELEILFTDLLKAFEVPFLVDKNSLFVSVSIGASCFPKNATCMSELVRQVDAALISVKHKGGGGYQVYNHEESHTILQGVHMESELHRAIKNEEFEAYYQAKVDAETGIATGCEVLMRWRHPSKGIIPPCDFIPVLESTGLILPIGQWLINNSLAQLQAWRKQGFDNFGIAINVSSRQVAQIDFYDIVMAAIEQYDIPSHLIELELTESAFIAEPEEAVALVTKFKQVGVSVAIDDFGTGYSSFSYLRRFQPSTIKIDKSFIDNIVSSEADLSIVQGIIDLSHKLQLQVVAEGVETEEQWDLLRLSKCNYLQGYHFSRPMPAQQFLTDVLKSIQETTRENFQ